MPEERQPCYDIKRFFELLHPTSVFELRSPDCPKWKGAKQRATVTGWFNNHAAATKCAGEIELLEPRAIYCTLNACDPQLLGRKLNRVDIGSSTTNDSNIVRRSNVLFDLDPSRIADTNSTDGQMLAALDLAKHIKSVLESSGWPPLLLGMSGNGATLIGHIDLPNDEESETLIKNLLCALANAFDNEVVHVDRGMFNASRITKALGSMTRKGDNVVGVEGLEDMPQRRSFFYDMEGPLQVIPIECLKSWADLAEHPPEKTKGSKVTKSRDPSWLDNWLKDHGVPVDQPFSITGGRKWFFKELAPPCGSSPSQHGCDRGQYLIEFDDGKIVAGCHHSNCHWKWKELRLHYEPDAYQDPMLENIEEVCDNIYKSFDAQQQRGEKELRSGDNPNNSRENDSNHHTTVEETTDFVPFPTEALPDVVANFINDTAKSIDCDPSFVALPVLAVLASAIGNSRVLQIKKSWYAPPVLWTVVVSPSGTSKSPPFKLALRPTYRRQNRLMDKYKAEYKEFERQQLIYSRDLQEFKKNPQILPPVAPEEPVCERVSVDDTTIEALAKRLAESKRGLLCAKDELSGWFASFARYKQANTSDEAKWLEFYNSQRSIIDRASSKCPIVIPRAAVCLTGTIQPEILKKCLTAEHKASGLAARLLYAMPPKRIKTWTDFEPSDTVVNAFELLVDGLFDIELSLDEHGEPVPKIVRLDKHARDLFISYFTRHNKEQQDFDGELYAAYSKLEEVAARIALVVHLVRSASQFGDGDTPLDMDSMAIGIQICEWFKNEARRVYGTLEDTSLPLDRKIITWLKKQTKPVTGYDLHRKFRTLKTGTEAEAILQRFVSDGIGDWIEIKNPAGGKPTRGFSLKRCGGY